MDTLIAFIGAGISFVTGWFVGLNTEAYSAFVLGIALGLILPWLWRAFIGPALSRAKRKMRLQTEDSEQRRQ